MSNLTTDEHGRVLGFPHHDGALEAVLFEDDGRRVTLVVRSSDSILRRLVLRHVEGLHIDDMRQGNIIQSVQMWDAANALASPLLATALKERLYLDLEALRPNAVILHLTPSYGADVLAVCGEVQVLPGEPAPRPADQLFR